MIIQEYDLVTAVDKYCQANDIEYDQHEDHIDIFRLKQRDDAAIVTTTIGKFWCKSFEDRDANIYMDVEILPN